MKTSTTNIGLSTLVLSVIATGAVLTVLHGIMIPFTLAAFLAILFKPLVSKVRKLGAPTWVGLIVVLILSGGAIYGLSVIVSVGVQSAIEKAPEYAERAQHLLVSIESGISSVAGQFYGKHSTSHLNNLVTPDQAVSIATQWLGSAVKIVADGTLVLLFLVFMVLGGEGFPSKLRKAFRDAPGFDMMAAYEVVNNKVLKYLRVKTIINLFTGLIVYGILALLGVDFAAMIGLIAFFLNYLPNIGSFLSTVIPGLVAAIQYESFGFALIVVVVLVVVQNIIGNFIEPKVMGANLDLSPVAVLFSLALWGWMWGIVGMVLSVPILAVLKSIMEQFPTTKPVAILLGNGNINDSDANHTAEAPSRNS